MADDDDPFAAVVLLEAQLMREAHDEGLVDGAKQVRGSARSHFC